MMSVAIVLALAAVPTPDAALVAGQAADARLAQVAWQLQTSNTALCRNVRSLPGFDLHALAQYPGSTRPAVAARYGIGDRPGILAVVPGSAAERAGISVGDILVAIDGVAVSTPVTQSPSFDGLAAVEDRIDVALDKGGGTLTLESKGAQRTAELSGDRGCASRVQLIGGGLNSSADGRYVQITGAMFDFVASDDELAAVVGHELAHNILGHRALLDARKAGSGLFPGAGKGGALLRQTESEADRLSVWLVARAGFDVDAVLRFWTRLRTRADFGIFSDATHPAWKGRLAALSAAIAEVKAQRAAGKPLVPPATPAQQSSSQP